MSKATNTSGSLALSKQPGNASLSNGQKIAALGGIVAALAASSCCILPVALFSLGISGAWIGSFTGRDVIKTPRGDYNYRCGKKRNFDEPVEQWSGASLTICAGEF